MSRPDKDCLTVLYDGDCPLCSREIGWYRMQASSEFIRWVDLRQTPQLELPEGIERRPALERFHVIQPDGLTVTGAAAFLRLWQAFPRLRRLAGLLSRPWMMAMLERGYRLFLPLRPWLARLLPAPRNPHAGRPWNTRIAGKE